MRSSILFSAAVLGLISAPAFAGVNLTAKIVGTPAVSQSEGGATRIKFDIEITNSGADAATGTIRVKPILVPEKTSTVWPEHGGRVLDPIDTAIDLASAKSSTVTYDMQLPKVPKGSYFVAAIVNSNGAMAETSLIDNVTDLTPIGDLEVTSAAANAPIPVGSAVLDFISSNGAQMDLAAGVIKHELNTYSLSASKADPDFGAGRIEKGLPNNSGELFARFMFADTKTRKVYTVIYQDDYGRDGFNVATPEKFWFLVTWHNLEKLLDGRWRKHDTYAETTHFDGVPPGDYKYLVLINSHDFPETDVHNDLSVYDISIRAARPKATATVTTAQNGTVTSDIALPELWLVSEPGKAPSMSGISWGTDYSSASLSSAQAKADAPWARLVNDSALTLSGDSLAPIRASLQAMDSESTLNGTLAYDVASIPSAEVFGTGAVKGEVPVTYFVRPAGSAPAAEFAPASLELEDTYEGFMAATPTTVTVRNPGNSELRWKALGLPSWLSVEPKEGTIAAGQSTELKLTVDPNALNRGDSYSAQLQLMTNIASGAGGVRVVPVDLTIDLSE